jgi:transcription termination/antitermination protein NusA
VLEVEGVTLPMAVALGEASVKTVEDLADLATDELRGAFESKNGERVRVPGALESFNLSVEEAEGLILRARVAAGWIEAADLEQPEEEAAEGEEVVEEEA